MTQAETELLPCPCGWPQPTQMMGREICRDMASPLWHKPQTRVWCVGCGATIIKASADEAIAAWNRRTPPEVSAEGVSEEAVEAAWTSFTNARYGGHDSNGLMRAAISAAIPHLRPSTPEVGSETLAELTRPIIGIDNRTAQEAFDIMCDRIRFSFRGPK